MNFVETLLATAVVSLLAIGYAHVATQQIHIRDAGRLLDDARVFQDALIDHQRRNPQDGVEDWYATQYAPCPTGYALNAGACEGVPAVTPPFCTAGYTYDPGPPAVCAAPATQTWADVSTLPLGDAHLSKLTLDGLQRNTLGTVVAADMAVTTPYGGQYRLLTDGESDTLRLEFEVTGREKVARLVAQGIVPGLRSDVDPPLAVTQPENQQYTVGVHLRPGLARTMNEYAVDPVEVGNPGMGLGQPLLWAGTREVDPATTRHQAGERCDLYAEGALTVDGFGLPLNCRMDPRGLVTAGPIWVRPYDMRTSGGAPGNTCSNLPVCVGPQDPARQVRFCPPNNVPAGTPCDLVLSDITTPLLGYTPPDTGTPGGLCVVGTCGIPPLNTCHLSVGPALTPPLYTVQFRNVDSAMNTTFGGAVTANLAQFGLPAAPAITDYSGPGIDQFIAANPGFAAWVDSHGGQAAQSGLAGCSHTGTPYACGLLVSPPSGGIHTLRFQDQDPSPTIVGNPATVAAAAIGNPSPGFRPPTALASHIAASAPLASWAVSTQGQAAYNSCVSPPPTNLVVLVPDNGTWDEGTTHTHTVHLSEQPIGPVAVAIASGDPGAVVADMAGLTFDSDPLSPNAWSNPQLVTLTGVTDPDANDETVALTYTSSGGGYTHAPIFTANITDTTGLPQIVLNPVGPLDLDEGTTATYTVELSAQPTSNVDVQIGVTHVQGDSPTSLTVSVATVTFTTTDWNVPRTLTITAAHDLGTLDEAFSLTHAAPTYTATPINTVTLAVNVDDDDTPELIVIPDALPLTEGGAAGTYTVHLSTVPSANVTVATGPVPPTPAVTIAPASLTITPATYNTPRTVTVTPAAQDLSCADVELDAVNATTSTDAIYNDLSANVDVDVTNTTPGNPLTFAPGSLTVNAGGTATYTVQLSTAPSGPVTVNLASDNGARMTVSPATVTFTTGNWNLPRTVTVDATAHTSTTPITVDSQHTVTSDPDGCTDSMPYPVQIIPPPTPYPVLTVTVAPDSVWENGNLTFTFELDGACPAPGFTLTPTLSGEATTSDYMATGVTPITMSDTAPTHTVTIASFTDVLNEGVETVILTGTVSGEDPVNCPVNNVSAAVVTATGSIRDIGQNICEMEIAHDAFDNITVQFSQEHGTTLVRTNGPPTTHHFNQLGFAAKPAAQTVGQTRDDVQQFVDANPGFSAWVHSAAGQAATTPQYCPMVGTPYMCDVITTRAGDDIVVELSDGTVSVEVATVHHTFFGWVPIHAYMPNDGDQIDFYAQDLAEELTYMQGLPGLLADLGGRPRHGQTAEDLIVTERLTSKLTYTEYYSYNPGDWITWEDEIDYLLYRPPYPFSTAIVRRPFPPGAYAHPNLASIHMRENILCGSSIGTCPPATTTYTIEVERGRASCASIEFLNDRIWNYFSSFSVVDQSLCDIRCY